MVEKLRNKAVNVKKGKRTNSSRVWLQRQLNDDYVHQARSEGYRSRAAFKLIEINEKFRLLKKNMVVVDLGAAPGGWSQVAANIVTPGGVVIGIDLLPFDPIKGVINEQMDFYDHDAPKRIVDILEGKKADFVMSDMAANTTGHKKTDHLRIMDLCEKSYLFAKEILSPDGHFVAKIFRGGAENELLDKVKTSFGMVKHFKPKASRADSAEMYLIAKNFRY
jgi:23S rRNA (uridine2552-2'-O)-methyltransferase